MAQITRIKALKGAGILADRTAKDLGPQFLRYNLIYGFNSSGKSTLSRLFSCLQSGTVNSALPDGCSFCFELSDGTNLTAPDQIRGLEGRMCVFNTDFIDRNLRWAEATANSIFYISEEQADAASALKAAEADLPSKAASLAAAEDSLAERIQTLATFKRGLAKRVAAKLHLANRKYEAPQLQTDLDSMTYDASSGLTSDALDQYENMARRTSPPPRADRIELSLEKIPGIVEAANHHATATAGETMVADLVAHPAMVPWARSGHEYHTDQDLKSCLLCGKELTKERKDALAAAFDDTLSRFIAELEQAQGNATAICNQIELALTTANQLPLMPELSPMLQAAVNSLDASLPDIRNLFTEIQRIYEVRRSVPTSSLPYSLPNLGRVGEMCERVDSCIEAVNAVVRQHNEAVEDFVRHQQTARDAIKRHFFAESDDEYQAVTRAVTDAQTARDEATTKHTTAQEQIVALRMKVRTHGPAAETVTKLVKAYLGHGELTIVPAEEGYELHRHGKLVKGPPSEGEKTALALCYFLSTLGADGRRLNDLIVVIDDPISSLDTKAMNYACALIRTCLRNVEQLFVLTHNQHCMNEFKKDWKPFANPKNPDKTPPTATLLYLDVSAPASRASRSSMLVEMSPLLREYDSEYHFLCKKVLEFEAAESSHSDYGFLMPNIIRRVLELFLAFKVPGTAPIKDKLSQLCKLHSELDSTRMVALERLCQVESHSSSIDDFIAHSSVAIEETRDANVALLELMRVADEGHTAAIRRQCNPGASVN